MGRTLSWPANNSLIFIHPVGENPWCTDETRFVYIVILKASDLHRVNSILYLPSPGSDFHPVFGPKNEVSGQNLAARQKPVNLSTYLSIFTRRHVRSSLIKGKNIRRHFHISGDCPPSWLFTGGSDICEESAYLHQQDRTRITRTRCQLGPHWSADSQKLRLVQSRPRKQRPQVGHEFFPRFSDSLTHPTL